MSDDRLLKTLPDAEADAAGLTPPQPGEHVAGRFQIIGTIGSGSNGTVLSAHDLACDREVAMKVLRGGGGPALAKFVREARITARLDHPSVPPVHTIEFLPDGGVLFTMRKIDGISLGEALRRGGHAATTSPNAVINVVLRVCEALSRAHALGYVHRDVKPDNILLGDHGEVALVDWGECLVQGQGDGFASSGRYGTPAYMSPEQARGATADARSDVYGVGATLWHALTGRFPCLDEDPDRFWERKRRGDIDPLPREVERRLPQRLLAIARHAMAVDPAARYQGARELARDLERFQAGQAVAAYHDSALERLARWTAGHARVLIAAAVIAGLVGVAAAQAWRQHQRTATGWGEPILVEDFDDGSWVQRWRPAEPGSWELRDGRIVSTAAQAAYLMYDRKLSGGVAIDYEGEIQPGSLPCDLSIIWVEGDDPRREVPLAHTREVRMSRSVMVQAGAFSNRFSCIYDQGQLMEKSDFRLTPGKRHRIRVELDGNDITLAVDGATVLHHRTIIPIGTGTLSFYAYFPGKAFDRVRVWQRTLPEMQSVLASGDLLFSRGMRREAAAIFQSIADGRPGTALADEALLRAGLSLTLVEDHDGAAAAWRLMAPGPRRDMALAFRLSERAMTEGVPGILGEIERSYADPALRPLLRQEWVAMARACAKTVRWAHAPEGLPAHPAIADGEALLDLRRRVFPQDPTSRAEAAWLRAALGPHERLPDDYPDELPSGTALLILGRPEQALARFGDLPWIKGDALAELGRFTAMLEDGATSTAVQAKVLMHAGRFDEARRVNPNYIPLILHGGGAQRLLDDHATLPADRIHALIHQGRAHEAVGTARPEDGAQILAAMFAGRDDLMVDRGEPYGSLIPAWRAARARRGDPASSVPPRGAPDWASLNDWMSASVILPMLRHTAGDAQSLRHGLEGLAAEPVGRSLGRVVPFALYALGRIDRSTFLSRTLPGTAAAHAAVAEACAAALRGDPAAERTAWQALLDLPIGDRMLLGATPDPAIEELARLRISQIGD